MNNIIDSLKWRYAVQVFDSQKKLSQAQLDTLLEAARLAPSSFGIQPWKFIVVTNPAIRAELRKAAWDQPKVTDASHLVVFAVRKNVDAALVDKYIASTAQIRGLKVEALKGYEDMIKGSIAGRTSEQAKEWGTRQLYIAFGTLLTAAAVEGIDAGPMEGFDPKKFDEILGLEALGLESRIAVAVGFRSPDDKAAQYPKSRFSKEEVVVEVK